MASESRVLGLKELADALRELPRDIVGKNGGPLRRALRYGAGSMLLAARRNASQSRDKGNLEKAIVLHLNKKPRERGRTEAFWLGVKRGKRYRMAGKGGKRKKGERWVLQPGTAYYGRFVEFGTKHQSAQPYMRPAFEATKFEVVQRFREELSKEVVRIAKQLASKSTRLRRP